jgi:hypothetical protein
MPRRWRLVFPVVGLALFGTVSYHSFRMHGETERAQSKYFWWSVIRLDADRANRQNRTATSCKIGEENCWDDLRDTWVDPGLLDRVLVLSAFPAFAVGWFATRGLGRLGISQVSSFMCLMPVLIFVWYYFIGWLLNRRLLKRRSPLAIDARIES